MQKPEIVNAFIATELLGGQVAIENDEDLLGHAAIDSLAVVGLVAFLEKEFDVHIPPEDVTIDNFRSVQAISSYLDKRAG